MRINCILLVSITFIKLAFSNHNAVAVSPNQSFDSTTVVNIYREYISALNAGDTTAAAGYWNSQEKALYPLYDLTLAPPMDFLILKIYRAEIGVVTDFSNNGDFYTLEIQHQLRKDKFIEKRFFLDEEGQPKLANLPFVMSRVREPCHFQKGLMFMCDSCAYANSIIAAADSAVIQIETTFGVSAKPNMRIYLVNNTSEAVNYPRPIPGRSIPANNMAVSDLARKSLSAAQQIDVTSKLMQHEMVHVILADTPEFGADLLDVRFIREGLAVMLYGTGGLPFSVFEREIQARVKEGKAPSIGDIYENFSKRNENESFAYAASFMNFLYHKYDLKTFQRFCRAFHHETSLEENIKTELGSEIVLLDEAWRESVKSEKIVVLEMWEHIHPF